MADPSNPPAPAPPASASGDAVLGKAGGEQPGLVVEAALTEALPVQDVVFGGAVLLLVVMVHAVWVRMLTSSFLKRSASIEARHLAAWRAEVLFAGVVLSLLTLHLFEVVVWSAALVFSDILPDWDRAAYFAANCYTALGEPFRIAHQWRIVPPIIAMSGIFTFAWTASVLVNFVSRHNQLRETIIARQKARHDPGNAGPRPK